MSNQHFTTTYAVDQSPDEVYAAINDVRGWWSGQIDGPTDELGGEFTYRYQDLHVSTQLITELVPSRRVAWRVVSGRVSFAADPTEWTGTDITFDITTEGDRTMVRFAHVGLVPEFDCFEQCSAGWRFYINESLRQRITTGRGQPNPIGTAHD